MGVHIFGIRHHGPGCARAVRAALEELQPDCILVEGPPDAQAALPLLMHAGMVPPVALLIYMPDQPSRAVYYPFTTFSPEWQALSFGLQRDIPTRFFDLPQAIQFAREPEDAGEEGNEDGNTEDTEGAHGERGKEGTERGMTRNGRGKTRNDAGYLGAAVADVPMLVRDDPLALLAEAAGYSDHELWWEQQIEQRQDVTDLFGGILEAMTVLRADQPPRREDEQLREAHMRQQIRAAQKEGFARIAVVCGAWHSPALVIDTPSPSRMGRESGGEAIPDAKADAALLKGLPKVAVTATWIPWTNSRLAYRSGYGAGVTSPGWYAHLWHAPDRGTIRWLARVAEVLRTEGFDVSSASVIEAVRLAEALAALRELPMPGLAEMHEATLTVLCHGEETRMQIIRDKVEIGEQMGAVPPETPMVPLQRDLEAQQRHLRLKTTGEIKPVDLDLREEHDRAKSRLLHRLRLLEIPWGKPQRVMGNKQGTFHEIWTLQWQVEFVVKIIEANVWGNTVEAAATSRARNQADAAGELPHLTELLNGVILADLPEAVEHILMRVQIQAAIAADVRHLMNALPPLARVARYSDVRGTKAEQILPVIDALFERVLIGLPTACSALDDDAAQQMAQSIDAVQECVVLLDLAEMRAPWHDTLRRLLDDDAVHGLLRGRCCRLLLEDRVLDEDELQRRARLALALAAPTAQAAAWVEGVLRGSGRVLLHQDGLWVALDRWLADLAPDTFVALLPLLRRAFAGFEAPERRMMGDKVKHLREHGETARSQAGNTLAIDRERADLTLPALAQLLGVKR